VPLQRLAKGVALGGVVTAARAVYNETAFAHAAITPTEGKSACASSSLHPKKSVVQIMSRCDKAAA
jgi:hypothetical protein